MFDIQKIIEDKIAGEEAVTLAQKMIRIDSQNPPGKEKELAEFMREILGGIGLKVDVVDFLPNRPNIVGRYLTNIENAKTLIFDGHMDTVPVGDISSWTVDPFSGVIKNGQLYGRGSVDMKSSIAAFICALKTILDSDITLKGNVTIILTSDEEVSALGTKKVLEKGYRGDAAIVGEQSNLEVNIAHKGVARWKLATFGKSTHASTPQEVNAIYKMAKAISKLEEMAEKYSKQGKRHPILGHPTLCIGVIKGGTKDNVVPDFCEITIDRRLLPGEDPKIVEEEFHKIFSKIAQEDPEFKYKLTLYHLHNPAETPSTHPFIKLAKNVVKDILGKESVEEGFSATTEMSHLVEAGIPSIILGCGDVKSCHTVDEHVPVQQIIDITKIYALLLLRYLGVAKK
jgi:acetylornithine deacetylase/succinyl-diaminopimelate desuccinylase family protein